MKVGLSVAPSRGMTFDDWYSALATAERLGFPSLFAADHFCVAEPRDSIDPYLLFALAAAQPGTVRFGPLVSPITFREPWNVGRMAAQIDLLSQGRFVLGLGVGWHGLEHRQFGIPYPPLGERFDRLEETIGILRAMWGPGPATVEGRYYQLSGAQALPKPAAGRPPILLGGGGEKRTLRLVAAHADEWNAGTLLPEAYAQKREVLARYCDEQDRDPGTIRRSMMTFAFLGADEGALRRITAALRATMATRVTSTDTEFIGAMQESGAIAGSTDEAVDRLGQLARAGVEEIVFLWPDVSSTELPEYLAAEISPRVASL